MKDMSKVLWTLLCIKKSNLEGYNMSEIAEKIEEYGSRSWIWEILKIAQRNGLLEITYEDRWPRAGGRKSKVKLTTKGSNLVEMLVILERSGVDPWGIPTWLINLWLETYWFNMGLASFVWKWLPAPPPFPIVPNFVLEYFLYLERNLEDRSNEQDVSATAKRLLQNMARSERFKTGS